MGEGRFPRGLECLLRPAPSVPSPLWLVQAASAKVVINEIFYHAPGELEDLHYVELLNDSDSATDLGGWSLGKGIEQRDGLKSFVASSMEEDNGPELIHERVDPIRKQLHEAKVTKKGRAGLRSR